MATIISHSAEQTFALGEQFGRNARAGDILGLSGDLGAGKTEFVKGLAQGLGFKGRVQSPTFALINSYSGGRLPLFHIDLYRLETPREILSAALDDYFFQQDGVTVIEWVDRLLHPDLAPLSPPLRHIRIETVEDNVRRISYDDPRA